jgi:hypothetical protein
LQAGFVTVFVFALRFWADSLAFGFSENQFLVCYSYFFLVFSVYVFLLQWAWTKFKSLHTFRLLLAHTFLVAAFHFIPQVVVLLLFCCSSGRTIWLSAFSKISF